MVFLRPLMNKAKIAISLDQDFLQQIDDFIKRKFFSSRSHAIQVAVAEKIEKIKSNRLAVECSKLNPDEEKALADEGLIEDFSKWPKF